MAKPKKQTRKEQKGANFYDKIIKENLEAVFLPLTEQLFGFKIIHSEVLPEKLQITVEREPDFIRIVETEKKERFILHLEFQTHNDEEMVWRMAEYKAMIQRKHRIFVEQYVIFLGEGKMTMRTQLPDNQMIVGFKAVNIRDFDVEKLIASEIPEAVLLAVLANYNKRNAAPVLKRIFTRLLEVSESKNKLEKYIVQLNVLSRLRRLENLIDEIKEDMPITYDITQDGIFLKGKAFGVVEGVKKGIEKEAAKQKAIAKAKQEKRVLFLFKQSILTIEQIAKLEDVSVKEVQEILKKIDNKS